MEKLPMQTVTTVTRADGAGPRLQLAVSRAKVPITMWGLLMWAYGPQRVDQAHVAAAAPQESISLGGDMCAVVCDMLATGVMLGAGHNGSRLVCVGKAHQDAEAVHARVRMLPSEACGLVMRQAKAQRAPEWNPELPPARVIPMLKPGGKPLMIVDPFSRLPVACRIRTEGYTRVERAIRLGLARETYARWWSLLAELHETVSLHVALTRWALTGIGAEREPWATRAMSTAAE